MLEIITWSKSLKLEINFMQVFLTKLLIALALNQMLITPTNEKIRWYKKCLPPYSKGNSDRKKVDIMVKKGMPMILAQSSTLRNTLSKCLSQKIIFYILLRNLINIISF
jgi:hypothetical protein